MARVSSISWYLGHFSSSHRRLSFFAPYNFLAHCIMQIARAFFCFIKRESSKFFSETTPSHTVITSNTSWIKKEKHKKKVREKGSQLSRTSSWLYVVIWHSAILQVYRQSSCRKMSLNNVRAAVWFFFFFFLPPTHFYISLFRHFVFFKLEIEI